MSKYQRLAQNFDEHTTVDITKATAAATSPGAPAHALGTPAHTKFNATLTTPTTTTCDNRKQFSKFFALSDDDEEQQHVALEDDNHRVRHNQPNVNRRYETTTATTTAYNTVTTIAPTTTTTAARIITTPKYNTQTTTTIAMLDENTMEVPLLNCNNQDYDNNHRRQQQQQHRHQHNHNNNNNHHNHKREFNDDFDDDGDGDDDYDNNTAPYKHCHTNQAGFGAQLMDKTTQEAKSKIIIAIFMCVVFMIVEFLGGYFAGSLAIMTDAAHLASDCITFIIGLVSLWLGTRPPDARMSFGYKRMEVLGAVFSILGIWILTATLVIVAVQRICLNDYDLDANTMMAISGIGILINVAMIFVLHGSILGHGHSHHHGHAHTHASHKGHSHGSNATAAATTITADTECSDVDAGDYYIDDEHALTASVPDVAINLVANGLKQTPQKHPHKEQNAFAALGKHDGAGGKTPTSNLNVRAALIHVIGDLVQSVGVFLAAVFIHFYPNAKFVDPLCTLLFSIIVILTTVQLFRESMRVLLDAVPAGISLAELERDLAHIDGVRYVHHVNVWQNTSQHSVLMAHLVIDFLSDSNTVLRQATQLAGSAKYEIQHCTIQIERLSA